MKPWIGVDLDGTLAHHDPTLPFDPLVIGRPVDGMVVRVRSWIKAWHFVKVFTARVAEPDTQKRQQIVVAIQDWCEVEAELPRLPVTCIKDYGMLSLWDDRAVHVQPNTGFGVGRCLATGYVKY